MKRNRQEKLLELISRYEIETQDELIGRLRENGYEVTQATVSRDLKELKLTKAMTAHGGYRYALNTGRTRMGAVHLNNAMADSIVQVDYSMNTVVIKTYPGLASAVAGGIDRMDLNQILGCVAGDDTIMVVTRDVDCAEHLAKRIHDLLRDI